ncbi:sugar-binding transcriptional regulator [Caballeronia sp. ATUFL_M2_KS44]|uniref:sugar-binding transcriptional regulator n=1 Tax=Caballeronia sp. ATUFL_M2_KS44 TaxID=2921767 RepID=UPI002027C88D|nr:sugar-binding transcriptional regulator [Caballeronia sp. ATUFL_M2_KS44]
MPSPVFKDEASQFAAAVQVAKMYYYQDMTTEAIAQDMKLSRSKVSRLLGIAHANGLVEIRINDPSERSKSVEMELTQRFRLHAARVVPVPEAAGEAEWLRRVAMFTASYLNTVVDSNMVVGIAWGTTMAAVSDHLIPKSTANVDIVQLNGAGNAQGVTSTFSSNLIMRFAMNFDARPHPFHVPAFFDYAETKRALWRERSVRQILDLQSRADIMLCSVGVMSPHMTSHVYSGGFLEKSELESLRRDEVVGDIATVFFRADGTYRDIALNRRASGPDLGLLRRAKHTLCVVSGRRKVEGVRGALRGGFIKELIIDEPTARALLAAEREPVSSSGRRIGKPA